MLESAQNPGAGLQAAKDHECHYDAGDGAIMPGDWRPNKGR
jgi:hypothetical protein